MSDPAYIRSYMPLVIGLLGSWLTRHGLHIDNDALSAVLVPLIGGAWYSVTHTLEKRWPQVGWLLGMAKAPVYAEQTAVTVPEGQRPAVVMVPDDEVPLAPEPPLEEELAAMYDPAQDGDFDPGEPYTADGQS